MVTLKVLGTQNFKFEDAKRILEKKERTDEQIPVYAIPINRKLPFMSLTSLP
jgi:hypothetical protein